MLTAFTVESKYGTYSDTLLIIYEMSRVTSQLCVHYTHSVKGGKKILNR
jgi:hypothetical protein